MKTTFESSIIWEWHAALYFDIFAAIKDQPNISKAIRIASVLLAIAVVYVGLSLLWHAKIRWMVLQPTDPFADPIEPEPGPLRESAASLGNIVFFDFKSWYAAITHPTRSRRDPDGKPYFENYEDTWYTAYLWALKRKSLFDREADDTAEYIRFTTIPSWPNYQTQSHEVKIEKDGTITLHSLRNFGSQDHTKLSKKIESEINEALREEEWDNLLGDASKEDFWKPISEMEDVYFSGLDGSHWLFERSTPTSYELIDFWTPLAFTQADGSIDLEIEKHLGDSGEVRSPAPYAQLGIRFMIRSGFAAKEDFVVRPKPKTNGAADPFGDPFQ